MEGDTHFRLPRERVPPVPPATGAVLVVALSRPRSPLVAARSPSSRAPPRRGRPGGQTTITTRHKEMSSKHGQTLRQRSKRRLHSHTSCRSFPGFSAQCHSSFVFGPRRLCPRLRRRWSSVRADSGSEGSTEARPTDEARLPVPGMANAKGSVT